MSWDGALQRAVFRAALADPAIHAAPAIAQMLRERSPPTVRRTTHSDNQRAATWSEAECVGNRRRQTQETASDFKAAGALRRVTTELEGHIRQSGTAVVVAFHGWRADGQS